jgi:hypothetical protein
MNLSNLSMVNIIQINIIETANPIIISLTIDNIIYRHSRRKPISICNALSGRYCGQYTQRLQFHGHGLLFPDLLDHLINISINFFLEWIDIYGFIFEAWKSRRPVLGTKISFQHRGWPSRRKISKDILKYGQRSVRLLNYVANYLPRSCPKPLCPCCTSIFLHFSYFTTLNIRFLD